MTARRQASDIPAAFANRLTLKRGEVAKLLGCSERFVDRLIEDGTLRSKRVRTTVFIVAADVWGLFGDGEAAISDRARALLREMG